MTKEPSKTGMTRKECERNSARMQRSGRILGGKLKVGLTEGSMLIGLGLCGRAQRARWHWGIPAYTGQAADWQAMAW